MLKIHRVATIFLILLVASLAAHGVAYSHPPTGPARQSSQTYYVSSSGGNDDLNDGLSQATPFRTIAKVNSLALQPGDKVLFKCGDTWRAEMLVISRSGASGNPITFGSYPDGGCADQPVLSGAQPIAGWAASGYTNIYTATLTAGANAGKFPNGVNQLFRNGQRLTLGRWPNLDAGDGGYSTIDGQSDGTHITDAQLPAVNWAGAVAHIRGMRWYILNRQVTGRSGTTLTLGAGASCWGGCTGWGYFLNNHLSTLDRDGEWYYDAAAGKVYLYSGSGAPADNQIEGSVILKTDDRSWGGVLLGADYQYGIAYVVVENLAVRDWFRHGIATPTNHHAYENHDLTLHNNTVQGVDGIGVNLMAWVYDAQDDRPDGWRGGYNLAVSGNAVAGANSMGINTASRQSTFADNVIRDVGLISNLGAAGMGCDFSDGEGACTEDGDGLRIKVDRAADSGNYNTVSGNRLERIAYNGMDVFGHHNTFEHNVISQACYAKGDCGGVRTYGSGGLSSSPVHDLLFNGNIILDTIGNTDGCNTTYDPLFGFGLYFDNYSRDVTVAGNSIISSTVAGILYQNSTGAITGNTLYNNSSGSMYSGQVDLTASPTYISSHTGNVLYGLRTNARTLEAADKGRLGTSDNNYFFNPYLANNISVEGDRTLAGWQSFSGKDAHSKKAWFTQAVGEDPLSRIFYNDTSTVKEIDLGTKLYLDLDQNEVKGSLTLQPYTSQVLIDSGESTVPDLSRSSKAASALKVAAGDRVTYTISIRNIGVPLTSTARLTDAVPAGLSYLPGTLAATSGSVDASQAPTLRWSGTVSDTRFITVTYAVTVATSATEVIANTALIDDRQGNIVSCTAHVDANFREVYLPAIQKH